MGDGIGYCSPAGWAESVAEFFHHKDPAAFMLPSAGLGVRALWPCVLNLFN